jgi:ribose-phosphate pyrophosphokinase
MHVIGEIEGRNCVIMDDMIDTAGTLVKAAEVLNERGAKSVYAYCTHPVFSCPAIDRIAIDHPWPQRAARAMRGKRLMSSPLAGTTFTKITLP